MLQAQQHLIHSHRGSVTDTKQNHVTPPEGKAVTNSRQHRILQENATVKIRRRKRNKSRQAGFNLRMPWTSHVQGHCQPLQRYSGTISTLAVLLSLENYLISVFTPQRVTALEAHKPQEWLFLIRSRGSWEALPNLWSRVLNQNRTWLGLAKAS